MKIDGKEVLLVACSTSYFDDDIKDKCPVCGKTVYYRPYSKPMSDNMACEECALSMLKHDKEDIDVT